jgi:hypothetical protein
MKWVIDDYEVVHHSFCSMIYGNATPYGSAAKNEDEMCASLDRLDIANKHSAPSPLVPCDQCLLGLPVEP